MAQTEQQLEELGKKAAATTIALTATLNEELNNHLRASGWLATNPGLQNQIWLETAYLGCYVIQKKITIGMSGPERDKFISTFRREFMSTVLAKTFKLASFEEEGTRLMLEGEFDDKLKKYDTFQGRASELFKDEMHHILVGKSETVKMNANSMQEKIMSKATALFGSKKTSGQNSPISDDMLITIGENTVRLFDAATI